MIKVAIPAAKSTKDATFKHETALFHLRRDRLASANVAPFNQRAACRPTPSCATRNPTKIRSNAKAKNTQAK